MTTSAPTHSGRARLERGAHSRLATMANTASAMGASWPPAMVAKWRSRPRRRQYAHAAATAPAERACSTSTPDSSHHPRSLWVARAATIRSSSPVARSADASPKRATTSWRTRPPSRTASTRLRYSYTRLPRRTLVVFTYTPVIVTPVPLRPDFDTVIAKGQVGGYAVELFVP